MAYNSYVRTTVEGNKYVITRVEEHRKEFDIIPLKGNASVTEVGGNGRFVFFLDNLYFVTEFADNICSCAGNYYDYSNVVFDIDIREGSVWSNLYNGHESDDYWRPVQ